MKESGIVRVLQPLAPSEPLPTGTVTFLLADIEGSVRLWEADGAAMTMAIRRFECLVDEEVLRHRGVRPVEQGEGDSFVVAFAGAVDALSCAVALQRRIAEEPWPTKPAIRVRMALHSGDSQLRDEGNYVGNAINRAGRLRSLAHGGQILASPAVFELVADGLPEAVALRDLGLQHIRDLGRPLRVYQITHPDLDDAFPSLRSLEVLTQHLPNSLTSFVGREPEVRELVHQLSQARLLTVTGAGGCGKTRLALEAARATVEHYPDGLWFADLSLVRDPVEVPRTVAIAIGRQEQHYQDATSTLVEHLRPRRALLLVDNCEHLLAACGDLARALLQACPTLTILATSREPLRVDGEVSWRVPSMSTPGPGSHDSLDTYDAVRLFIDRAIQARPNFVVNNVNAPAVAAICQQLDGLPLPIELAAARVRLLSADQIAAGLSDRFRLLRGGAHPDFPRQQTLTASVEWSHDLLAGLERAVLYRLSVFAGGFTLDAAEQVGAGPGVDVYEVLDLLSSLVDKSLVVMDERAGQARYRLSETIRQFARNRLERAGELEATRERHANWYATFAFEANGHLTGPDQVMWFARVDDEHDNLRAALDWATHAPSPELGASMVAALAWFWNVRGHWHEAVRWIRRVQAGGELPEVLSRPVDLLGAGMLGMIGETDASLPILEVAAACSRKEGDHWSLAWALNLLGKYTSFRDMSRALAYLTEAEEHARSAEDCSVLADTLACAAWSELMVGRTGSAAGRASEARRVSKTAGDARGQLVALNPLAAVAIRRADYAAAAALLDEAMELASGLEDRFSMAVALLLAGQLDLSRGQLQRANELFGEGVEVGRETGTPFLSAASSFLAAGTLAAGDPAGALAIDDGRRRPGEEMGNWLHFLSPRPALRGEALLASGALHAAEVSIEETLAVATASGHIFGAAQALLARARVSLKKAEASPAEADAHRALATFVAAESVVETISTLEVLAGCATLSESHQEGARLLGATQALRGQYGCARPVIEQATWEQVNGELRAHLDRDTLASALAEGATMSIADACAYAARGRGERKRPATGWASLTPTEVEVARLVATGATNGEVAERLFISVNTVKAHLAHVFAKIGVSTRSELAMRATTRGL